MIFPTKDAFGERRSIMDNFENLFNEDILISNMKGAAYFILLYEHFEDCVISAVKEIYSTPCVLDGVLYANIDEEYIKALKNKILSGETDAFFPLELELKQAEISRERYIQEVIRSKKDSDKAKNGKRLTGSLLCLKEYRVLSESDISRILQIRKRRNDIVHELFKVLSEGLAAEDASMIADLLTFKQKISVWYFREFEMPLLENDLPEGAAPEDVMGIDDVVLTGLFRILFLNEGDLFKAALEELKGLSNP